MNGHIRVAIVPIDEVLPYIFTKELRYQLKEDGYNYSSKKWISYGHKKFDIEVNGVKTTVNIPMGSHRYQLFAEKGIQCVSCGMKGQYFAIERNIDSCPSKFHLNLYGKDDDGKEVMITKDHILPKSKGGENRLSNYQTMCIKCNRKKANRVK